jgi:hypothetical protein
MRVIFRCSRDGTEKLSTDAGKCHAFVINSKKGNAASKKLCKSMILNKNGNLPHFLAAAKSPYISSTLVLLPTLIHKDIHRNCAELFWSRLACGIGAKNLPDSCLGAIIVWWNQQQ